MVLVHTYLTLRYNATFFFELISCFGKGDTIGIVIMSVAICRSHLHSKDKYLIKSR